MKIQQRKFSPDKGWETFGTPLAPTVQHDLVLVFGCSQLVEDPDLYPTLRKDYPDAAILINSTAGEIIDTEVNDNSLSLTAMAFERTTIKTASVQIAQGGNSYETGKKLGELFDPENLSNVLIISDGQFVNGSELVEGLHTYLPESTIITGGLAGDGSKFQRTLVGLNEPASEGRVVAVGFYGGNLSVSHGSVGGWDSFGPERLITRSEGNVLYELDGKPALEIYKDYLGEFAKELPSTGLLFPLSIRSGDGDPLVRTILGINEEKNSLVFAGNMPEGSYARLMKASFDRLIEGAEEAAQNTMTNAVNGSPDLAILISCVGRKLVLNQRIEEEVEVIKSVYGNNTAITGFYSYGEISPSYNSARPELHNQTMTITTFTEHTV